MTPPYKHAFDALGTQWVIESLRPLTNLEQDIAATVGAFDRVYSRFRADSLVSRQRADAGTYEFPDDAAGLFELYESLYELTGGRVTPLIGELLEASGYDAAYSFQQQPRRQSPPRLEDAYRRQGSTVTLNCPALIDVGAAGKGLLVDKIAALLEKAGHTDFVVDGSGDLIQKGRIENRVGLEHPLQPGKAIGALDLRGRALAASATNRRAWGNGMHHVIDPLTLEPVKDVIATWAVAETAMLADGLATALFFVEPEVLAGRYNYEYVRMRADGTASYSSLFKGKLF